MENDVAEFPLSMDQDTLDKPWASPNLNNIRFSPQLAGNCFQFVNHLRNSQELSNKACLVAHLGFYQRHHQIFIGSGSGRHPFDDPGTFFPRSWDLSTEGGTSLLRAFAVSASVALLRQAAAHGKGNADSSPPPSTGLVAAAAIVERYANFLRGARHSPEMEPVGPGHCRPEEGGQEVIISRATPGSGRGRSRDDSCVCRRREGVIGHHHHGKPDPELTARFAPPAEGARGSREGGGEEEDRAGPWVEGEKGEGSAAEAWTQPADGWAQGQEQMSEATLAPQDMDDNVVEVGGPEWTSVVSLWENVLSGRATVSRETATTYTTTTNTTTKDWCKMEKNVGLPWTEGEQVYSSSVHREEGEKQGILSASQDLPAGAEAGARERLCRGQKRLGNKGEKFLRPRAGAEAGAEAGGGGGTKARVGGPGAEAALLRSSFVGWGGFRKQCAELVRSLEELDPQAGAMMGEANAWAVKPPGMSCGRGVVMLSSLRELVKACRHLGNRAVVQKYVERPLLIKGRKFDIRQWVLLTSLNPLVIWGFGESYLRFSSRPFTLKADSLSDSLIHLCNHSIQKDAPTSALAPAPAVPAPTPATIPFPSLADDTSCPTNPLAPHPGGRDCFTRVNVAPGGEDGPWSAGAPPCSPSPGEAGGDSFEAVGNMWGAGQFREHLMERFQGDDVYTRVVLPNIRRVVVQTLLAVQESLERKGRGLEWFGFDLILTEDLQAKLIEVNVSPDVSHSTPVTARLAPAATEDLFKIIFKEPCGAQGRGQRPGVAGPGGQGHHRLQGLRPSQPPPGEPSFRPMAHVLSLPLGPMEDAGGDAGIGRVMAGGGGRGGGGGEGGIETEAGLSPRERERAEEKEQEEEEEEGSQGKEDDMPARLSGGGGRVAGQRQFGGGGESGDGGDGRGPLSLRWELWHKGKPEPLTHLRGIRKRKELWFKQRRLEQGVDPEGAFVSGLSALDAGEG